jgi:hypothetical protein
MGYIGKGDTNPIVQHLSQRTQAGAQHYGGVGLGQALGQICGGFIYLAHLYCRFFLIRMIHECYLLLYEW